MAESAKLFTPNTFSLATTLTRLDPGIGVRFVYITSSVDVYLVYAATSQDGGALGTDYYRIPALTPFPIPVPDTGFAHVAGASADTGATLVGVR